MSWIDITLICIYLATMLGVGVYFMRKNKSTDDYYVGGRKLSSLHIGLSVVATDVGGCNIYRYRAMDHLNVGVAVCGPASCIRKDRRAETIVNTLEPSFLSLTAISWQTIVNWMITIIPIWFIGMTLYQRIYASKDRKTAQKGWLIAGLFEYPIMAFVGVILGMFARVALENGLLPGYSMQNLNAEMGLPVLIRTVLPVGFLGIVLAAYFSAIMSTADSCLMAASGNILADA